MVNFHVFMDVVKNMKLPCQFGNLRCTVLFSFHKTNFHTNPLYDQVSLQDCLIWNGGFAYSITITNVESIHLKSWSWCSHYWLSSAIIIDEIDSTIVTLCCPELGLKNELAAYRHANTRDHGMTATNKSDKWGLYWRLVTMPLCFLQHVISHMASDWLAAVLPANQKPWEKNALH